MTVTPGRTGKMSIETTFDADPGLVNFRVTGRLELGPLFRHADTVITEPGFRTGMHAIWDLRDASYEHLFADDFAAAARNRSTNRDIRGEARVAIVVSDALGHGLSRVFLAVASMDYLAYRVFNDIEQAKAWVLGGQDKP